MTNHLALFLFFQLIFFSAMSQSIEEQIKRADELFEQESYAESLKVRRSILSKLSSNSSQQFLQQKSKQLLTEAHLIDDYEKAILKINSAFSFLTRMEPMDMDLQMDLYNILYHSLAYNDQIEEALKAALESKAKIDEDSLYNDPAVIDLIYDIAYLYDRSGNYFEAITYYKQSLELYIEHFGEENDDVALNLNNLAYSYSHVYNSKYTIANYRKAAEIWEKVYAEKDDVKEYLVTVYQNLNAELISYGDLEAAKLVNNKISSYYYTNYPGKVNPTLSRQVEVRQMMLLSNVRTFAAQGDFKTAMVFCDSLRSETVFTEKHKKDVDFLLSAYMLLSDYTYEKGDYPLTLSLCNSVSDIANHYELQWQKMKIHATLGTTYEKLQEYDKGLFHINLADANANKKSFNASKFSIQMIKASILLGQNEVDNAQALTKTTIEQIVEEKTGEKVAIHDVIFEMVNELGSANFINIFSNSGKLYLDFYKRKKDPEQLEIAENLFTISANLFQEYYLKGEFNEVLDLYHQRITEGLLEVILLKKSSFEAKISVLNLIERNASQHLLKEYEKKVKRNSLKNDQMLDRSAALKQELAYYLSKKTTSAGDSILTGNKLQSIRKELDSLTEIISETEKNYVAFTSGDFDMKDVLTKMSSDLQILKYYVTENYSYSALISKDALKIQKVGENKQLKEQISDLISQAKDAQSDFKKVTGELYSVLVPDISKQKITIIPDNILNYVPFETLYNKQSKEYLVQKHVVSYEYSLPMWLLHQETSKRTASHTLAAFAPEYSGEPSETKGTEFRALRFAGQEASTIASLFPGDLFSKDEASKEVFLDEKDNYSIFHLSMHSELYEDDFNQSFLLFSNDEKLFFSELYGMNIPAQMVVLSACNTGNGLLKKGEGIMSLSRALTYAGVESSIVSLWQVPDKETSEIMIAFYENLKGGQSKDEALANAKNTFIKNNPMKTHPFYWAGFIVNGNTNAIQSNYAWIYYILGLLLFLLILGGFLRKKTLNSIKLTQPD